MPAISGVLGGFESILQMQYYRGQRAVLSWAERSNIGGREITAVTIVTVLNSLHFHLDLYLYSIIYIII